MTLAEYELQEQIRLCAYELYEQRGREETATTYRIGYEQSRR